MTLCDAAWLVVCERETAIARMETSRGLSREEAEQRLASATDWREREPMADRVFHNDGTPAELLATADEALAATREAARNRTLPQPRWHTARAT
jgi:dephospho-CoA kinase